MQIDPAQPTEQEAARLPIFQEDVQVHKRLVDTGRGVRIHKTVAEHPCQIGESLLREGVEVRHVPVDRIVPLDQAPATRYEGDTLVVPILEDCLLYTSPSPRDKRQSRMPSSA